MANARTVMRREGSRRGLLAVGMLAGATVSAAVLAIAGPADMAGASHSHAQTVHVATAKVPGVGTVLTTDHGLTLYYFEKDPTGKATCTGVCAKIWPPYVAAKGAHVKGPKGVKGLSVINVGGHGQVAFHDHALYHFKSDSKKGQAKGQHFAGVWFAALKSGIPAMHAAPPASAPASPTTQPPATPTTQAPATPTTQAPAATTTPAPPPPTAPATVPPTTTPPMAPPPATPTTLPPTTTTTSGGGYGY